MVLDFFIVLVVLEGSTIVDGELGDDDIINSISEGGKAVEDCDFVRHERRAGIVDWDNLQDMTVDGVTFSEGPIHLRVVMINIVIDEGGDNKVASRGVGNGEFVEGDSKRIIQYPSLTWVIPTYPLRGWMVLVSLQRLGRCGPGVIILVGLLVVICPGRVIVWPDSPYERVLFLLTGFVAIDRVKDWV
jgi:hypothetical protein